jgi:polyphenol oxidase
VNEPVPVFIPAFQEWKNQVRAGFSTRNGGFSSGAYQELNLGFRCGDHPDTVHRNWDALTHQIGLSDKPLVLPKMIHGDRLFEVETLGPVNNGILGKHRLLVEPEGVDAVFSRSKDPILAVTMADCLTALIFDPIRNTIAAVHAGWRGTQLGILAKTITSLRLQGHLKPRDTWVTFGPCLRPKSLEVGPEVAIQFTPRFITEKNGKFFLDMPGCNRVQAIEAGIPPEQIRDSGADTMTDPIQYFSYRRDGQTSGRMSAFISLV